MTITLVDSNVLLDIATDDPRWSEWSAGALASGAEEGPLAINPIIYPEVSIGFATVEDLDDAVPPEIYVHTPLPYQADFLAGKAFSPTAAARAPRRLRFPTSILERTRPLVVSNY